MELPGRSQAEEDAFVARFRDADDDGLMQAVVSAVEARRVSLAARLVGLLEDDVDNPAIARARAAAELMLHPGLTAADVSWCAMDDVIREIRRSRMRAHKDRQRAVLKGTSGQRRISRVSRKRR